MLESPLHRILQVLVHPDGEGLDVQNALDFEGSDVEEDKAGRPRNMGTQFTWFTGTKVQILVQKYKY